MKILVFRNENTLLEHLGSRKEPVPLLDFTRNPKVKEAAPGALLPADTFTAEEKKQIRDEYIDTISDLGAFNEFSLSWLCHPISEKNDLAPDHLLDRLVDFLTFFRVLTGLKTGTLLVLAGGAEGAGGNALVQNIIDFSAAKGIECQVEGGNAKKRGLVRTLGSRVKKTLALFQGMLKTQSWFLKSRFLWKKLDKTKTYTIIRTWFDGRSPSLLEQTKDIYFGRLPGFLKDRGHYILYFGEFAYGFDHIFAHFQKGVEPPVLLGRSLVQGLDFLKAARFMSSVKHNIRLKTGMKILDMDVDIVFNNYFYDYARHHQVQANYLSYLAVVKLMKQLNVDVFYLPFENYAWEKLSWLAISQYSPESKVVAFQHAQVALNATKFFLGQKESDWPVFPDKLVTLGEVTREVLIQRCHLPARKLVTGCALRQDYSISSEPIARTQNKQVLVQLWSVPKSIRTINFIHASQIHPDKYRVSLSPHPCNPLEVLIPHLDFKYENHFHLAAGSLGENFRTHDIVIYHGTTACLDALANGLPVIEIEFDDFITVDPLFDFHDFKWTVREPGKLAETIETIYALSDEEYYQRQQKGFEFVKKYFYPVNEENLQRFLI